MEAEKQRREIEAIAREKREAKEKQVCSYPPAVIALVELVLFLFCFCFVLFSPMHDTGAHFARD
jgi:hypothetical protein